MADDVAPRDANFVTGLIAQDDTAGEIDALETDPTTKRLKVDAVSEEEGHAAVGSGTLYIRAIGDVRQLSSQACKRVFIQADESNSGVLCIGGSSVSSTAATRQGKCFYPTQGDWFKVSNVNLLYATSTVAGDGLRYFYEN